jgi:hypothetical protein
VGPLQLFGEALWVAGRDEHAVDPVGDDIAVAGDRRGDCRGAGGEGLGEDHAEALAGERGGAEQIGLVQSRPQILPGDPAADVDPAHCLGIGEVAKNVVSLGPDHREAAGDVLHQSFKRGQEDRQALALLGAADEQDPQLLARWLRRLRRRIDVDTVGDHLVVTAEPAPTRPGGGLGNGDPGREPVEHPPGSERRGDVVGDRLGRVGVEGSDRGGAGPECCVPADQRHDRLVNVDHVVTALAKLTARSDDATDREGGEIGDRAIGGEPCGATHRRQVIGNRPRLRGRAVKRAAEPVGRVERGKHAHVMAAAEKLLGESLYVPVHAPLVTPGIWRDESNSHEALRVVDAPAQSMGGAGLGTWLQLGDHQAQEGHYHAASNLNHRALQGQEIGVERAAVLLQLADVLSQIGAQLAVALVHIRTERLDVLVDAVEAFVHPTG